MNVHAPVSPSVAPGTNRAGAMTCLAPPPAHRGSGAGTRTDSPPEWNNHA